MTSGEIEERGSAIRIQHVALEVPAEGLERAAEFWRLVGFEPVEPPPSLRQRSLWLEAGPADARAQIHLLPEAAASGGRPFGQGNHVAIVAPDWDRTVTALTEAGFDLEQRRPHWGAARAFATLPGGHTVELMAAPPAPSPAPAD